MTDDEFYELAETYQVFFDVWMNGYNLQQCIDIASSSRPYGSDFPITLDFPLAIKFTPIQNIMGNSNKFRLKIYGYAGIKRTGYDSGYDGSPYY